MGGVLLGCAAQGSSIATFFDFTCYGQPGKLQMQAVASITNTSEAQRFIAAFATNAREQSRQHRALHA